MLERGFLFGFLCGRIAYRRGCAGFFGAELVEWAMLVPDLHFAVIAVRCFLCCAMILVKKKR
jgi:hypothetical protein